LPDVQVNFVKRKLPEFCGRDRGVILVIPVKWEWVAAAKHVPTLKAPASAHELENFPLLTGDSRNQTYAIDELTGEMIYLALVPVNS